MKKVLTLLLLVALISSVLSSTPRSVAAQSRDTAMADMFPDDAGLYAELDTRDIPATLSTLGDLINRAQLGLSGELLSTGINLLLSNVLGRSATFARDVAPWLGDKVAVGVRVAADSFDQTGNFKPLEIATLISIKNDSAARRFADDLNKRLNNAFIVSQDQIGNIKAVIYQTQSDAAPSVVFWPGFALVAANSTARQWFIAGLQSGNAGLGSSDRFTRVMGGLKPETLLEFFISGEFSRLGNQRTLNTPIPGFERFLEFARNMNDATLGQGIGFRAANSGKLLAMDVVQSIDQAKQKAAFDKIGLSSYTGKTFTAKLANRIPSDALAVVINNDLGGTYRYVRDNLPKVTAALLGNQSSATMNFALQINTAFATFESALKTYFDLDMRDDVLSWAGGDYAVYLAYNPDGEFQNERSVRVPLDAALILDATNSTKARAFVNQISQGLPRLNKELRVVRAGDGTYRVNIPQTQVNAAFGLVGNTILLTTGSGLERVSTAARGTDTLTQSEIWQNAISELGTTDQAILFVNLVEADNMIRDVYDQNNVNIDRNTQLALNILNIFESAVIYGNPSTYGDAVTTLALVLK